MSSKRKGPAPRPKLVNAPPSTNGHASNGVPGGPRVLTNEERRLERFESLIANATTMRRDWLQNLLDPRRNVEKECGYPTGQVGPQVYQDLFDREPIANRVVQILPRETWQVQPLLYEDESPDVVTPFERAWDDLARQLRGGSMYQDEAGNPVWEYLLRADVLSGIGQFGVILIGLDDGLRLDQPAEGVTDGRPDPKRDKRPDNPSNQGLTVAKPERSSAFGVSPYSSFQDTLYSQSSLAPPNSRGTNDGPDLGFDESSPDGPQETSGEIRSDVEREKDDPSVVPLPPERGDEGGSRKLLFLRVFGENLVQISRWNSDPSSPRFGAPEMYRITLSDPTRTSSGIGQPSMTVDVHWTRVIHVADNLSSSEVLGTPRMQPVLNRLLDVQKISGAAGEGYWKQAFSTLVLESNPQLAGDVDVDRDDLRSQLENLDGGLQRSLVLLGMQAKTLPPSVTDPTPFLNAMIEQICVQIGVPVRVFKGSERGELASSQDDAAWNDRLKARQMYYVTPRIVIPFVDRLIAMGILPKPKTGKRKIGDLTTAKGELDAQGKPAPGAGAPGEEGGDEEAGGKPSFPPFSKQRAAGGPPKFNAFCPTGAGGGQDNSCSSSASSAEGRDAVTYSERAMKDSAKTSGHIGSDVAKVMENIKGVYKTGRQITAQGHELLAKAHDGFADRHWKEMGKHERDNITSEDLDGDDTPAEAHDQAAITHRHAAEKHREAAKVLKSKKATKNEYYVPTYNALPFDKPTETDDEDPSESDGGASVDDLLAEEGDEQGALDAEATGADGAGESASTPGYSIEWPDIDSMTDLERAQVFNQRVAAWAAYTQGGVDQIIPPEYAMTHLDQFDDEEAMAILAEGIKRQEETLAREAEQMAEFGFKPDPQNPGAMIDPDQQEAENEIELAKAENPAGVQQSGPPSPFGSKPGGPPAPGKKPPFVKNETTDNVFCATGDGGGIDPSCGNEGGKSTTKTPKGLTSAVDEVLQTIRGGGKLPVQMNAGQRKALQSAHKNGWIRQITNDNGVVTGHELTEEGSKVVGLSKPPKETPRDEMSELFKQARSNERTARGIKKIF